MRAAALAVLALAVQTVQGRAAETIVLNNGRTIDGSIIRADANTVMIRHANGRMAVERADDIQAVYIPPVSQGSEPILGVFLGWQQGAYRLLVNYQPVSVENGVATPLEPKAAAAPPEPAAEPERQPAPVAISEREPDPEPEREPAPVTESEPEPEPETAAVTASPPALAGDDGPVTISVSSEDASEGDPVIFRVELSRPADDVLVLIYASVDGTAKGGRDYDVVKGILNIQPGETSAEIETPTIVDDDTEGGETFAMFVSADRNSATIARSMINATIVDR